jgi:hypothetical protein
MDSWPRPDAGAPPGPRINGGLEVQVVETYGDWTKVEFSNGWSAWVDGRLLVGRGSRPAQSAIAQAKPKGSFDLQAMMADRTKAFAVGGAALIALASILPWLRGGGSSNSYKVSIQFLFDYKTTSNGGIKVGWLLMALAIAIVAVIAKNGDQRVARGAGIAAIVVAVLFVIQLQRLVSAVKDSGAKTSLTDVLGFGVLPAIAGGILAAFAPKLAAKRN